MYFSDLALSKRLERAEGSTCVRHAEAHRRLFPDSGADWMECAGAYAVFDGIDSPITQTFGLGIFEELTEAALNSIEKYFLDRGAPVVHEVSPFAGTAALGILCDRCYKPVEISSVLVRPVERPAAEEQKDVSARIITPAESQLWSEVSATGWSHEHPELLDFLLNLGSICAAREETLCFLAEYCGRPGAAALLGIHDGVAVFGGSATVPELRHHGLHSALLDMRMRCAFDHGCKLAMIVAQPGSASQRNAERNGFRIAYTRTKWQLQS
jgi:GNAT superfamily N-acetyltransferase